MCVFLKKVEHRSHHARVDRSLLYITSNAGHECIPVFKVGVKISLQREGGENGVKGAHWEIMNNWGDGGRQRQCVWVCTWYMIEEGGGSMHGCWSGRGSSSSRSTLDRASSRVTWVVMVTRRHSHNTPVWQGTQKETERGYEMRWGHRRRYITQSQLPSLLIISDFGLVFL